MRLITLFHYIWYRGIRVSIVIALILLAWDAVLNGTYILSAMVCPVWILFSVVKNLSQTSHWKLTLVKIMIPVFTLGLVLANDSVQSRIAKANAARVVAACEQFHVDYGRFPQSLDELVPRYIPSVPRAKYCLDYGRFLYWNYDGNPMLVWYAVPPFGREVYNFKNRTWGYID